MTQFFEFEADFIESLRCIPMQVRYKLDTCGIKLKLSEWNLMNQELRQNLITLPCDTKTEIEDYKTYLQELVLQLTGKAASELLIADNPPWINVDNIPESIVMKSRELGINITISQWSNLTKLQRFALIKLSHSHHENANFLPALKEFNLLPTS